MVRLEGRSNKLQKQHEHVNTGLRKNLVNAFFLSRHETTKKMRKYFNLYLKTLQLLDFFSVRKIDTISLIVVDIY